MIEKFELVPFDKFEWDAGNLTKAQKHGLTLIEIESVFQKEVFYGLDEKHSSNEERWIAVGVTSNGKSCFSVFSFRSKSARIIRVFSARRMHLRERRVYEKRKEETKNRSVF